MTAAAAALSSRAGAQQRLPVIRPSRLMPGDTVALVAPASATFKTVELDIAKESLEALGLEVRIGGHLLDRHGYLAGLDRDRAEDINRFFTDASIKAILPIRGCCRISTTTSSAAIRKSFSATATSPHC